MFYHSIGYWSMNEQTDQCDECQSNVLQWKLALTLHLVASNRDTTQECSQPFKFCPLYPQSTCMLWDPINNFLSTFLYRSSQSWMRRKGLSFSISALESNSSLSDHFLTSLVLGEQRTCLKRFGLIQNSNVKATLSMLVRGVLSSIAIINAMCHARETMLQFGHMTFAWCSARPKLWPDSRIWCLNEVHEYKFESPDIVMIDFGWCRCQVEELKRVVSLAATANIVDAHTHEVLQLKQTLSNLKLQHAEFSDQAVCAQNF